MSRPIFLPRNGKAGKCIEKEVAFLLKTCSKRQMKQTLILKSGKHFKRSHRLNSYDVFKTCCGLVYGDILNH